MKPRWWSSAAVALGDGTKVGHERVDCVDSEDPYGCVTDALNELGEEGWLRESPDTFPDEHVVYPTYRAG